MSPPRPWVRAVAWAVAVALVVERARALWAAPPTDFDDAYMFVRYADNLRAGFGMVWNRGGEHVYGATGLLHLLTVTLLRGGGWPDWRVLGAASLGAAAVAVAVMVAIVARFATHPWLRAWPIAVTAVVGGVAYSEAFAFHATSGMDTMSALVANGAVVFASLALAARPSTARALACALAAWLAIEARPDDAPIAVGTPLLVLALVVRDRRALVVRDRRALVAFVAPLVVVVAASLAAKRALLGTALPLAFWAKRPHAYAGFAGEYGWNPFWFLAVFERAALVPLAVVGLGARRRHARLVVALLVPAAAGLVALFGVNQIMGHLGRFYFPALASIVAAAAVVSDGLSAASWKRVAGVALGLAAAHTALGLCGDRYAARAASQPLADLGGYTTAATEPLPELDSWQAAGRMAAVAAAAPPGTRFAMSEHGLVAARASRAVIIDVLGLHDRWFALHGFDARELFRRRPDWIWMPHPDHTQMIRDLLDSDVLWRDYDFYPDALYFGVAIRKDDATLHALLAREYPGIALDAHRASRKMPP